MGNGKPNNLATIKMLEEARRQYYELLEKCLYNGGIFDTKVSNGDETGTITRRTRYLVIDANSDIQVVKNPNGTYRCVVARNLPLLTPTAIKSNYLQRASFDDVYLGRQCFAMYDSVNVVVSILGVTTESEYRSYFSQHPLIFQYELAEKYQYTEKVIENQPIHIANQEECLYWHEEWKKGLNLLNNSVFNSIGANLNAQFKAENGRLYLSSLTNNNANKYDTIKVNLLPNSIYTVHITGYDGYYNDVIVYAKGTSSDIPLGNNGVYGIELGRAKDNITFTTTGETEYYILIELKDETTAGNYTFTDIMLVRGAHPYPYEDYHGGIARQSEVPIYYSTDSASPAQKLGGTWESLGSYQIGGHTVYAWERK